MIRERVLSMWLRVDCVGRALKGNRVAVRTAALGFVALSCACEPIPNVTDPEKVAELQAQEALEAQEAAELDSAENPVNMSSTSTEPSENGAECADDSACDTGACVDGFCCEAQCDGLCVSCGVSGFEGQCIPSPSDDICPDFKCPGATECLGYDDSELANNCQSAGQCRSEATCAEQPAAAGTVCGDGGTCDGQGVCDDPNRASLGEGCSVNNDCAEGNCVEGADGASICCDASCDGVCEACGATGRCDSTPAVDTRCSPEECPADNVCRNYPELAAGQCGSLGVCEGVESCFEGAQDLKPDSQCACETDGTCSLLAGVSCQGDEDCGNNSCESTSSGTDVCCAERCAGSLFCSRDGSQCVECEGDAVSCDGNRETSCVNGRLVEVDCVNGCTVGSGCNTAAPIGFSCAQASCQAGAVCQQDNTGAQRCCSRDCDAEGKVCGTDGSCECPPGQTAEGNSCLRQSGERCDNANQCQGGRCTDGVCCAVACDGFCEQCQLDTGLCVAVPAEQQDDGCNNTHECTGVKGDCRARTGESCSEGEATGCVTGICSATAGGGAAVCCAEKCGVDLSCSSNGLSCVECETDAHCPGTCDSATGLCRLQLPDGAECSGPADCSGGICTQWFDDGDGDGFGRGESFGRCGVISPEPSFFFALRGGDCCDIPRSAEFTNPEVVKGFSIPTACGGFDYNCDGDTVRMRQFVDCSQPANIPCDARGGLLEVPGPEVQCGEGQFSVIRCQFEGAARCVPVERTIPFGQPLVCL